MRYNDPLLLFDGILVTFNAFTVVISMQLLMTYFPNKGNTSTIEHTYLLAFFNDIMTGRK